LADDDPFIRKGTGKYLEMEGFRVTTAESGEEAVSLLEKFPFDLVITDMVMGETDGIGVLKKSKEVSPETMNIILTGHGNMDSAIDAVRVGADDYLLKPCENEELLFRISSCLEKLELKRKIRRSAEALRKSEENLRKAKEAADMANQAKTVFLANMSHDIRTPLNAITGFSQILLERSKEVPMPDDFRQFLKYIHVNGENLTGLISDVLEISRIESGKNELTEEDFNLRDMIKNIFASCVTQANEKDVVLLMTLIRTPCPHSF